MSLAELLPRPLLPSGLHGTCALPLPRVGWGVDDAVRAVEHARPLLPALPADLTLVSALTTVVLRSEGHALKIYPPGTDAGHLDRLAAALAGATSVVLPVAPAVTTPAGVVTASPWVEAAGPTSWPELGSLLRAFHDENASADVPPWRPLSRVASEAALLAPSLGAVLLDARARLLDELAGLAFPLGVGVIHGDVSLANALRTGTGTRLIDLDWMARGPREYDLASAARRYRTGEITATEYGGFCAGYGYDVVGWPGLSVLDRIAELGGLAFRIWDCRHHGRALDWLDAELALLPR
jgi:hypothetical protein